MIARIDENGFIDIAQFAELLDISLVDRYEIEVVGDNKLIIRFYDANDQLIPVKKIA